LLNVMTASFPTLHHLFLISVSLEVPEAAFILRLIAKIYYSCIEVEFKCFKRILYPISIHHLAANSPFRAVLSR